MNPGQNIKKGPPKLTPAPKEPVAEKRPFRLNRRIRDKKPVVWGVKKKKIMRRSKLHDLILWVVIAAF